MITKSQRKKMKKVLKENYTSDVVNLLEQKKIRTKFGNPFQQSYVVHVFNGRRENFEVECAIIEIYEIKTKELKLHREKLNSILTEKPEAVTPGL